MSHLIPVNLDDVLEAIELDEFLGFCRRCGAEHDGVDQDATDQECEECGAFEVTGAEELLLQLA